MFCVTGLRAPPVYRRPCVIITVISLSSHGNIHHSLVRSLSASHSLVMQTNIHPLLVTVVFPVVATVAAVVAASIAEAALCLQRRNDRLQPRPHF